MSKSPQIVSDAEHLKAVVQMTMEAFQSGAGIYDGKPEPMTYELAVQTIWREIDKVFYTKRRANELARFRITKKSGSLDELALLASSLNACAVRASGRGESVVAHLVADLKRMPSSVLKFLDEKGWTVTDFVLGA